MSINTDYKPGDNYKPTTTPTDFESVKEAQEKLEKAIDEWKKLPSEAQPIAYFQLISTYQAEVVGAQIAADASGMYTLANMTSFSAMLLQEINLGGKTENPVDYTAAFKEQLKQLKEAIQSNSALISDSETLLESISKLEQSVENKTILQIWQASQDPANPAPGELNELITQMSMITNQLSNVSSKLQTQQSMMNADYEQRLTQGKKIVAQVFDLIKNITKKLGK